MAHEFAEHETPILRQAAAILGVSFSDLTTLRRRSSQPYSSLGDTAFAPPSVVHSPYAGIDASSSQQAVPVGPRNDLSEETEDLAGFDFDQFLHWPEEGGFACDVGWNAQQPPLVAGDHQQSTASYELPIEQRREQSLSSPSLTGRRISAMLETSLGASSGALEAGMLPISYPSGTAMMLYASASGAQSTVLGPHADHLESLLSPMQRRVARPIRPKATIGSQEVVAGDKYRGLKRTARRRQPFQTAEQRQGTKQTRDLKACIRCRIQRIRCIINLDNPSGACLPCHKLKASLSRLPCLRYKVTDSTLYRSGPTRKALMMTLRWHGTKFGNIDDWASPDTFKIYISQDRGLVFPLEVKRFKIREGDVLSWRWQSNGEEKQLAMPSLAIADIEKTVITIRTILRQSLWYYINNTVDRSNPILKKTFEMAQRTSQNRPAPLLNNVLDLFAAARLLESGWSVVENAESYGINQCVDDPQSPHHGKIPLTPIMDNQFCFIVIQRILDPLRKAVLKELERMILQNRPENWFQIFLAIFILLHSYDTNTNYDFRLSRLFGGKSKFWSYDLLRSYHSGAKTLLAHFHYCNKGQHPFTLDWNSSQALSMAQLSSEELQYVREMANHITSFAQHYRNLKASESYEEGLYLVSQLFEPQWEPTHTL